MKKLLAMMASGASASALNLIALTLAASKVDLRALDVYFVYRDSSESILKLLFVSQIGPICVAAMRGRSDGGRPVRSALLIGGAATAAAMALWTFIFPLISDLFLSKDAPPLITGHSVLELSVAVFCLFTWFDAIASTVLVQRRQFAHNHTGNFISAASVCLWMLVPAHLSVDSMAMAFAVGKVLGTLPKIIVCLWPRASENGIGTDSVEQGLPDPDAPAPRGMLAMAMPYTPSNLLQQFNKFAYLAGAAFLAPGLFAIFNIYRRYYTALQNLITVNIFNLSASRLTDATKADGETARLLDRHTLSFLTVYAGGSLVMLVCALPMLQDQLPEFITTPYTSLLWSVTLLNYLPDGLNFVLSRKSMLQHEHKLDSRLNSAQALTNLAVLYPSMRWFGIGGLAYATTLVCVLFAGLRLWHLRRQIPEAGPSIRRIALYGTTLGLFSTLSMAVPAWSYCLGTLVLSVIALLHLRSALISTTTSAFTTD